MSIPKKRPATKAGSKPTPQGAAAPIPSPASPYAVVAAHQAQGASFGLAVGRAAAEMGCASVQPIFTAFLSRSAKGLDGLSGIIQFLRSVGRVAPDAADGWFRQVFGNGTPIHVGNPHVVPDGVLDLGHCPWLTQLPDNMIVHASLDLSGCDGLVRLPDNLCVQRRMDLSHCAKLVSLGRGLKVEDGLFLRDCPAWDGVVPEDAQCGYICTDAHPYRITLADWRCLHPQGEGALGLGPCESLALFQAWGADYGAALGMVAMAHGEAMPKEWFLSCLGDGAPSYEVVGMVQGFSKAAPVLANDWLNAALAQGKVLDVDGVMNLGGLGWLTGLPAGWSTPKGLHLEGCVNLVALPQGLEVSGDLNLSGCRGLEALPEGLKVGGDLILCGCQASLQQAALSGVEAGNLVLDGVWGRVSPMEPSGVDFRDEAALD